MVADVHELLRSDRTQFEDSSVRLAVHPFHEIVLYDVAGDVIYDYATETLNIPEECIDYIDVSTKSKKVEITIVENREYINEDWYYCLLKYVA